MGRKRKEETTMPKEFSKIDLSKYDIHTFEKRPGCYDLPLCKWFSGSIEDAIEIFERKYGQIKGTIYCFKNEVYIPYEKE